MIKKITAIILTTLSMLASAQAFDSSKSLNVIVPFNPGGGTDIIFRNFQRYSEKVGVTVVPSYKPGANGVIGVMELAKSLPDGRTIAIVPSQSVAEAVVRFPNTEYVAISGIGSSLWAVVVNGKSDITSFDKFVQRLQSNNQPSFGAGASGQLNMINQILEKLNVTNTPVIASYNGAGPAVTDLIGGHIEVIVVPLSTVHKQLEAGSLRPIAVVGDIKAYSNLPNLQKQFPGWKNYDVFGFIMPKGTSSEAAMFWRKHVEGFLNDKQAREELLKDFTQPANYGASSFDNAVNISKPLVKK
jgi:tripartite-type tricarboxylate transporter receptor subunit TctC